LMKYGGSLVSGETEAGTAESRSLLRFKQ
jgi:hypothetical protein